MLIRLIIFTNLLLISTHGKVVPDYISDIGLSAKQLILKYGYPYQSYTVQTDDGYLLKLQRIPHGRHNKTVGHPVLVMPGLFSDSAVTVNMGPNSSLGFVLADNGYDVWLGNYRGSRLSRRHVSLNPDVDCKEYWDFSFHEIGYSDTTAFIDHILKVTGKENLYYIGHSQGATSYLILLSEKPQYASKIRFASLLGPAVVLAHSISPIFLLMAQYQNRLKNYSETNKAYEIPAFSKYLTNLLVTMCMPNSPISDACADFFLYVAGWTPTQINKYRISVIISNTPSGSSLKQSFHYMQLRSGIFRNYDYGSEENLKIYGQELPPEYNLTKATPPAGIYHGTGDWIANPDDVEFVTNRMPNVFAKRLYNDFNHLDVIWGKDAPKTTFKDMLSDMKFHS